MLVAKNLKASKSSKKKKVRKWYFDACALDERESYRVFMNHKKNNIDFITSHLSIGEAFSGCYWKGVDKMEAFIDLMDKLSKNNILIIMGNDHINKHFNEVINKFPSLSITDAVHLATALRYKCERLVTNDSHLLKLNKKEIDTLTKSLCMPAISISQLYE